MTTVSNNSNNLNTNSNLVNIDNMYHVIQYIDNILHQRYINRKFYYFIILNIF